MVPRQLGTPITTASGLVYYIYKYGLYDKGGRQLVAGPALFGWGLCLLVRYNFQPIVHNDAHNLHVFTLFAGQAGLTALPCGWRNPFSAEFKVLL